MRFTSPQIMKRRERYYCPPHTHPFSTSAFCSQVSSEKLFWVPALIDHFLLGNLNAGNASCTPLLPDDRLSRGYPSMSTRQSSGHDKVQNLPSKVAAIHLGSPLAANGISHVSPCHGQSNTDCLPHYSSWLLLASISPPRRCTWPLYKRLQRSGLWHWLEWLPEHRPPVARTGVPKRREKGRRGSG